VRVQFAPTAAGLAAATLTVVGKKPAATATDALSGTGVPGCCIYWANESTFAIGRANLDGTGVNQNFITGASFPWGVAVSP
jgi:hypothetical protein